MVDLTRTDEYPAGDVPDPDVETAMKVLRTLRSVALKKARFEVALAACRAHEALYEICEASNTHEKELNNDDPGNTGPADGRGP